MSTPEDNQRQFRYIKTKLLMKNSGHQVTHDWQRQQQHGGPGPMAPSPMAMHRGQYGQLTRVQMAQQQQQQQRQLQMQQQMQMQHMQQGQGPRLPFQVQGIVF